MTPVACFSVLGAQCLRDLTMQLNRWMERVPVQSNVWFDLAWEDGQVSKEITRRRQVMLGAKEQYSAPCGRTDRDLTALKRADLTRKPNGVLAGLAMDIVARIDRTLDKNGDNIDRLAYASQRDCFFAAWETLTNACGPEPMLRASIEATRAELEAQERDAHPTSEFRIVLNKRISLLIEIAKRLEEPRA